ncbi:UNVERIFIED_CONTAM: hypothetical protein IGO34_35575, partial [Salmonella enterica subsp. enterica serovar Weltevreden]
GNGEYTGIHFPSLNYGYVCGKSGVVKRIESNGSITSVNVPASTELAGVFFTSESTGYVCGKSGRVYKTTDYGASWTLQGT